MGIKTAVKQIPWKEFFIQQLVKILGIIIVILMVLFIIQLSSEITPNVDELNPDEVIGFDTSTYLLLILTSSLLFIFVVITFTKLILFDNKKEFGIDSFKSWRSILVFFLVINFISAVYLLLDSSLINVYLITGPVDVIWILTNNFGIQFPSVGLAINRLAYAQIRSLWFFGFYLIMIIFPIIMFVSILTRFGRTELFEREHKDEKQRSVLTQIGKVILFIFTPIIEIFLIFLFTASSDNFLSAIFVILLILGLALWWFYNLFLLIFRTVRFTAWFSYANFLLIFPIIILFYLVPVFLWTLWDTIKILSSGSVFDTIHSHIVQSDLHNQVFNIQALNLTDILTIAFKTLIFNATPFDHTVYRILQLDFVIIVGISAIVIGLAEGYSVVAIFKALTRGVSIAKTGRVASKSAPKLIVITSRLLMLSVWLTLIWDKFLVLYDFVKEEFINIILPDLPFFPVISYVFQFASRILSLSDLLVPLAILLVPLFVILISSFKFLSVTLIIERLKHDTQIFFLLISSAFVLITTQILQDITDAFRDQPEQLQFMPFAFATQGNLLPWASKVFENLEAGAFYIGLFIALGIGIKYLMNYLRKRGKKEKIPPEPILTKEKEKATNTDSTTQLETQIDNSNQI
jgi:hypothetical protein